MTKPTVRVVVEATDVNHYQSTACMHELHDRCRRECKWCAALCWCECHGEAP